MNMKKEMKRKILAIALVLLAIAVLLPNQATAQININKLKEKAKEKVGGDKGQNQQQGNVNQGQQKGSDDFTELANYYSDKAAQLKHYPFVHYNFGQLDWDENSVKAIETFDMPGTLSKMEQDKQKYPKLFKIYPKTLPTGGMNVMTKNDIPTNADKAGDNEDFPYNDDNARKINDFYRDYINWKSVSMTKQRDVAQLVNKIISNAESAGTSEKLDKSAFAIRAVNALKTIQPENPMLGDLEKRALQVQDKCFDDVRHVLTGELHKTHFKKLVGFKSMPLIGKENKAEITNEIIPGKPFYLVGYFANQIKELDLKGHILGVPTSKAPVLEWKEVGTDNNYGRMQLYWNQEMMKTVREQSYFVFEMFPDINKVNFKSHVEYIPIMNFVKWLTYQMPGKYQFYIQYSTGAAVSTLADNTFTINLTNESIAELKAYYEKLGQKKLQTVTFNNGCGCTDVKATIGLKDEMKKYGELLKLTVKETGPVMQPWPRDKLVDYYVGYGYGAFKRADGKHEIIMLRFRRAPAEKNFSFNGAEVMGHYEIEGSSPIKAEQLTHGYEITSEGITKCTMW
jgi:hypothetical protein